MELNTNLPALPKGWIYIKLLQVGKLIRGVSYDKKDVQKEGTMIIALPVADGKLAMHFGHCAKFLLVEVDAGSGKILGQKEVDAPEHQPGLLPPWLAEKGVNMIIAGGMGSRAQTLFAEQKIKVVVGAPAESPEKLVRDYLAGKLVSGDNICDH